MILLSDMLLELGAFVCAAPVWVESAEEEEAEEAEGAGRVELGKTEGREESDDTGGRQSGRGTEEKKKE